MTRTEYLYGFFPKVIIAMPNLESLHYRKEHAKILIDKLYEVGMYTRDDERIDEIHAAIKWCDRAIKELK